MEVLQIFGKGGFAREVAARIMLNGAQIQMFEFEEMEQSDPAKHTLIAIGDNAARERIFNAFPLHHYVNVSAMEYDEQAGVGSIICPGTILTVNVGIGNFTIINLNCTIGHDSQIGDFCNIAPGCNISGNVKIGNRCYIGSGTTIREGTTICDDVVIGMGSKIFRNITEPGTYVCRDTLEKIK